MKTFKTENKAAPQSKQTCAALCTPDFFALKQRCARLKRELKLNRKLLGI